MKVCARCGRRLPADPERRIYSRWSRAYYCAEVDACTKRARRRRRAEATR
jgi:hypothetical protein